MHLNEIMEKYFKHTSADQVRMHTCIISKLMMVSFVNSSYSQSEGIQQYDEMIDRGPLHKIYTREKTLINLKTLVSMILPLAENSG